MANVRPTSVAVLVLFWGQRAGESHLRLESGGTLPCPSLTVLSMWQVPPTVNWQQILSPKGQALVDLP